MISALTQRKVRKSLAMTGELTLRGKVLPVGGIKEKILAAKRSRIQEVILCHENKKDVEAIKKDYIKDLEIRYVTSITEVIDYALLDEKVERPLIFT
jgi:ATP-dependent Lon protease